MFHKKVFVGDDEFGNKYYKNGKIRSIKYSDKADPTTISPSWHLWLHYAVDQVNNKPVLCQNERQPNQTGTTLAWDPRPKIRQMFYVPWRPE